MVVGGGKRRRSRFPSFGLGTGTLLGFAETAIVIYHAPEEMLGSYGKMMEDAEPDSTLHLFELSSLAITHPLAIMNPRWRCCV